MTGLSKPPPWNWSFRRTLAAQLGLPEPAYFLPTWEQCGRLVQEVAGGKHATFNNAAPVRRNGQRGGYVHYPGTAGAYAASTGFPLPANPVARQWGVTVLFWNHVATGAHTGSESAFSIGNVSNPRIQSHAPAGDGMLYWDVVSAAGANRISTDYTAYLDKWTHVALVSNGVDYRAIHLNGQLITSSTAAGSKPSTNLTGVYVGAWPGASVYHEGGIDSFLVFDRVLSPAQIALAYAVPYAYHCRASSAALWALQASGMLNPIFRSWVVRGVQR